MSKGDPDILPPPCNSIVFDASSNTILGSSSYAEFKEKLRDSGCDKCALHKGRTNIVVDRGNPSAYIMVIGEGPGENEDKQGLAFVGRAGQLFDKIMSSVGFDTNRDMLIANVVKCRPPEKFAVASATSNATRQRWLAAVLLHCEQQF